MQYRLVCIALAAVILGISLAWGYASPSDVAEAAPASASNFTFGQLDWYDENGVLQVDDSSWGYMEVDVVGDPTQTHYLNVTADVGAGEAWIVENLPISPETIGNASPRQGMDFDITLLGLSSATDLTSVDFVSTVDGAIQTTAPSGSMSTAPVADIERRSFGSKLVSPPVPIDVGAPQGIQIQDAVKNVIEHKDVPGVQEEDKTCLAGAFARSIAFLLGKKTDADAQKIYDDLRALKVGSTGPNATTYEEDIKAKADYLKGKIPGATTKINDLKNAIGPIAGVTEETKDLVEWLKKELPTEDVELHYDGHIITVTGMYESGGKTFIKYRDDEHQGDDTKGDKAEKTAELKKSGNDYQFRQDGTDSFFTVQGAISESLPPVTDTITGCVDVVPDDASLWDFTLTGPTPGTGIGLGHGECHFFNDRFPGPYTLTETTHAGYNTSVDCGPKGSDPDNSIDFDLHLGENVTCNFTNTPLPVGGTAEFLVDGSESPASAADGSGPSAPLYAAIAGAAAAAFAIAAGGWYARRRWLG